MSKCPSCDYTDNELGALLQRIDDRGLLITLACDFADRVVDLTPDPIKARPWLQAARLWREYPRAADSAREAALTAATGPAGAAGRPGEPLKWKAARAVWAATVAAAVSKVEDTAKQAAWAALTASEAANNFSSEREWQLSHTKELACTCPFIPEVGQPGPRGRNSLLAQ